MLNKIIVIFTVILIFLPVLPSFARGRCPDSVEKLADFSVCMQRDPSVRGSRYVGTMSDIDDDHMDLYRTVANSQVSPPQVMPMSYYYPMSYYPYYSPASQVALTAGLYSSNPYWRIYMAMPIH